MKFKIKDSIALPFIAVLCFFLLIGASSFSVKTKTKYYEQQVNAAKKMQLCMDEIKNYKLSNNIPLSEDDLLETGMLGEEFNMMTTTLGDKSAKRTSASPHMAALAVRMFREIGLEKGDYVAAGFSGSFPSLNLAVISACEEMGLKIQYISSVGSSSFGANNPELCFPEMADLLYKKGLISTMPMYVTIGGERDIGRNMDVELLNPLINRLNEKGFIIDKTEDFSLNVEKRINAYKQFGDIDCFVGVGGNITTLGKNDSAISLGQGIIKNNHGKAVLKDSGLIEIYSAMEIPVVNFLNIKKITADYSMEFDPVETLPIGEGNIYLHTEFNKPLLIIIFMIETALIILYVNCCRKRK